MSLIFKEYRYRYLIYYAQIKTLSTITKKKNVFYYQFLLEIKLTSISSYTSMPIVGE